MIGGTCLVLCSLAFASELPPQTIFYFGGRSPGIPIPDQDGDGMSDDVEAAHGLNAEDPLDAAFDMDGDGLSNLDESTRNSNPWLADSDGDGISDLDELSKGLDPTSNTDTDADGLSDDGERFYFGSLNQDALTDVDGDGASNAVEAARGTDPSQSEITDIHNIAGLNVTRPGA
ncbi:MAG: hypothetical protein O3A51_02335 [Verrucomicrobia bacterium]|nr:hypothetical protein [Verrucomicrobiota bacterium]